MPQLRNTTILFLLSAGAALAAPYPPQPQRSDRARRADQVANDAGSIEPRVNAETSMDGSLQKRSMIVVHTTVKITTWTTNTITEGQPPTPTTAFTAPLDSESGIEVVTEAHSWTAATYTVGPPIQQPRRFSSLHTVHSAGQKVSSTSLENGTTAPTATRKATSPSNQAEVVLCRPPAIPPAPVNPGTAEHCTLWYVAQPDDCCSTVAQQFEISVDTFMEWNPSVQPPTCLNMMAGDAYCVQVCVPGSSASITAGAVSASKSPSSIPSALAQNATISALSALNTTSPISAGATSLLAQNATISAPSALNTTTPASAGATSPLAQNATISAPSTRKITIPTSAALTSLLAQNATVSTRSALNTTTPASAAAATPSSSSTATPSAPPDVYNAYSGDGTASAGWPTMDQWIDFATLWSINSPSILISCEAWGVPNNSPDEMTILHDQILSVGEATNVDPRFVLALIMQESTGCVRVITTAYSHANPGLMQSFNGTGSCNTNPAALGIPGVPGDGVVQTPCPESEIRQQILDGTNGTVWGPGLVQDLAEQGREDESRWYRTARLYNGGSIVDADLSQPCCTPSYASDVANRLMGWVKAPRVFP